MGQVTRILMRRRKFTESARMYQTLSKEVGLLSRNWWSGDQWPKRLEWIEISGIRGWAGERVEFPFPLMAICGENGVGKSTILQAAASIYRSRGAAAGYFAPQFFPDTPWDKIKDATIKCAVREGQTPREGSVRKPTAPWLGNRERRERNVRYLDLRRTQPIVAQRGYQKMIKTGSSEVGSATFDPQILARYLAIVGRRYSSGKHSWTSTDANLKVAIVGSSGANYSAFHQGAGENTVADLHKFNSPAWLKHIQKANAALGGLTPEKMAYLRPGEAYLWSSKATDDAFCKGAIKVKCRPRVTQHGGATKTAVGE